MLINAPLPNKRILVRAGFDFRPVDEYIFSVYFASLF